MLLARWNLSTITPLDQLKLLLERWNLAATTRVEWRRDKGEAFDDRFRGYEVDLRLIQPIGQALFYPWQIDTAGKPRQVAELSGEVAIINRPSECLAILRMRIWQEPRRGFLEGWWERNLRAIRWSIRDIDEQTSPKELETLLKLLRKRAKRGHPFGNIFGNREGLLDACKAAKAKQPSGMRITQDQLAAELNIDPRTLRYAMQDYGLSWDVIMNL